MEEIQAEQSILAEAEALVPIRPATRNAAIRAGTEAPACPAAHLAGLEYGQKRHLRLIGLIPNARSAGSSPRNSRAFDEIEEGSGNLFAGDHSHRVFP